MIELVYFCFLKRRVIFKLVGLRTLHFKLWIERIGLRNVFEIFFNILSDKYQ